MKRMLASLAGLAMVVLTLNGCGKEEPTAATAQAAPQDVFEWKMVTTWPKNFPGLGTGAEFLAKQINEMSCTTEDFEKCT